MVTKRSVIWGLALAAAGVLAGRQVWADILGIVTHDPEASHVLLAPLMLAWLVWTRRGTLAAVELRGRLWGPVLLVMGWALSWVGFYHALQLFWHLGAVLILIGSVVTVCGVAPLRRLAPVLVGMVFLVPFPGTLRRALAVPLQTISAGVTQQCFAFFGAPVTRTGSVLHLHGADIAIVEACNGMRLFFPLLMVTYAVAFAAPLRGWLRITILVVSPVLAVVCNIVRLIPTVGLYGYADASVAAQFHDVSGWLMAPLALLILLGGVRLVPRSRAYASSVQVTRAGIHAVRTFDSAGARIAPWLAAMLLAGIAVEAVCRPGAGDAQPFHDRVRLACATIPVDFGPWHGTDTPMPADVLTLLRPNALCNRTYRNTDSGDAVNFNIVQCQDARDMTGHFPPLCFAAHGWTQEQTQDRQLVVGGTTIPIREYIFARTQASRTTRLAVIHFVALPDRKFDRDLSAIWRAAADFTRRCFGAAQIELVFTAERSAGYRDGVACQFLAVNQPLLAALTAPEIGGTAVVGPDLPSPQAGLSMVRTSLGMQVGLLH
jgi:exosortase